MRILLIALLISYMVKNSTAQQEQVDEFAAIGVLPQGTRLHLLEEKLPPKLPNIYLPVEHTSSAIFEPYDYIDTKQELQAELEKYRQKYKPFLRDLSPELKPTREQLFLKEFKWRVQDKDDLRDFTNVLKGKGNWKTVKIPHYEPPLGRATTYYYKEVELTAEMFENEALFICFKGVDYKAHVFFNNHYCGSHEGFFAPFEFDITHYARKGKNTLVVRVENDYSTKGSSNYSGHTERGNKIYAATGPGYDEPKLGWHHCPPAMGIYQDCYIESRSKLHINDVYIRPQPGKNIIEAWVEVNNYHHQHQPIVLEIAAFGQNFHDTLFHGVKYKPQTKIIPGVGDMEKERDNQVVELEMEYGVNYLKIPLSIENYKLWEIETPYLYQAHVKLLDENGEIQDQVKQQFGIREFRQDTLTIPKGRMYLNGKQIRLRGANTMGNFQQCVMRKDWDRLVDDILLAKVANMNFLRFTQRPVQKEIYEYCDRLGMLNQCDFPMFGTFRYNQFAEAVKQAEEMERLVRPHPSTIMVTYINERFPNAAGYPHRNMATAEQFYQLFKAMDQVVLAANPDRVIKAGDGDYDPPSPGLPDNHCYNTWYNGHGLGLGELYKGHWQMVKPNWLYACGEFGAEGLDPVNVMQKYYPYEWLPRSMENEENWNASLISMAQTHKFHHMWFNTQNSVEGWVEASQNHQAWAMKLMTEAFRRDSRMVSFAIHLFIDAWPAGWMKCIMDVDRQPKKAFFEYKKALEPLMVSLRSDRWSFFEGDEILLEAWICNDLNQVDEDLTLVWQLENNGDIIFANKTKADVPLNSSKFQGYIKFNAHEVSERTKYTLRSAIIDKSGKSVFQNTFEFNVFPKIEKPELKVFCETETNPVSARICNQMGIDLTSELDNAVNVLFDNAEMYLKDKRKWDNWVQNGGNLVFTSLNPGDVLIGEDTLFIEPTTMGHYYFVSPKTGHNMVEKYDPYDFFCWYNSGTELISPLLSHTLAGDNWTPIIGSGTTKSIPENAPKMAVGQYKFGKGTFRACNLQLVDREANPVAMYFTYDLLE